ncbi:MAG: DUF502 domain-containing protein [Candidatus Babeliales bacterium]|jgi:uncharacterized membrane protein
MDIVESLKKALHLVRSTFLSGLFTLIPIAATLFFLHFLYNLVLRMLAPVYKLEPTFLKVIPGIEFVIVVVLILLLGVVLKVFIAHQIIHYFERLIARIPLVRIVYSSAKIVVDFFKVPAVSTTVIKGQKKVVLIPYPKKGQYHLAFLLESAEDSYQKIIPASFKEYPEQKFVKVFMPHSPNPTSGFFFIMPEEEIIQTEITFEEAIKTLVSCGLITPETLKRS